MTLFSLIPDLISKARQGTQYVAKEAVLEIHMLFPLI